jgi:arabinosaccharide transport system substrate-binding protein
VYGLPHDLHPAVLVYRPDILKSLGYSPEELTTWDDWQEAARDFYRSGKRGTTGWRYGLAFSDVEGFDFLMLLWQRGGDVFNASGEITIDSELAIDTLERYVAMFRSEPPAAGPKLSGWYEDFAALARGQIIAYPTVDWMLATMRLEAKDSLSGKIRCMPLPAWTRGGRRTSTSGGTMIGIPRACEDIERAWQIAKHLYFDHEALVNRFRQQTIIPPLRSVFADPVFDEPVPFFQGQPVGRLLTELAEEIPPVNGSPYASNAFVMLNAVFADVMQQRIAPREALEDVARRLRAAVARDQRAIEVARR